MFEELAELIVGPWGLAALVLFGASRTEDGRRVMRDAARGVIRAWYYVSEKGTEILEEAKEQTSDLIAEVKAEQEDGHVAHKKVGKPGVKKA